MPEDNFHVTLGFLGWVADERVQPISEALGRAVAGLLAGVATLAGLGAFPSTRRARVVWAGVRDPSGVVASTAAAAAEAMLEAGREPERRPFHAHVTLCRLRTPRAVAFPDGVDVPAVPVPVDRVTLFRSHLGRPAPRYEPLAVSPLRH